MKEESDCSTPENEGTCPKLGLVRRVSVLEQVDEDIGGFAFDSDENSVDISDLEMIDRKLESHTMKEQRSIR
eukprot:CAMPEP_0170565120 /NCGR_PEP_ID=MMETSP0211-20121228/76898_1 /TAXON_ID=311385 /ORGANISM="Pseudokeronopsis sp., Strain OXSARD2" /LENGTH=71 /DNA_ID=CAMNT_0010885497 /DNA_START=140 /DNA_END=355 /DNA_ORIENTATION=+